MVFVPFAATGGTPTASNVLKVMSDPEPTTPLMAPATAPAATKARTAIQVSITEPNARADVPAPPIQRDP